MCDLQILGIAGQIVVRLFAQSEYRLTGWRKDSLFNVRSRLSRGRAQFRVGKLPAAENTSVLTPIAVASVRGTRFEVSSDGRETRIALDEGSIAAAVSIAEMDSLPVEVVVGSRVLKAVQSVLREFEVVLEPGETIVIRRQITERIYATAPDFKEALNAPALASHRERPVISEADKQAAIAEIEGRYPDDQSLQALLEKIRKSLSSGLTKRSAPAAELQVRLAEYDQLIALSTTHKASGQAIRSQVAARTKARRDELMKEIERVMNKAAETLIFKNGNKERGVILTEDNHYILLTPEGRKSYPAAVIEGVDF